MIFGLHKNRTLYRLAEEVDGRQSGHKDKAGDDDVDILIRPNGDVRVENRETI